MSRFLKTLIIVLVFLSSMFLLLDVKGQSTSGEKVHRMVFIETAEDWKRCDLTNVDVDESSQSAIFKPGSEKSFLESYIIAPGFPFSTLLLSWNAERPPQGSLLNFQVEVSDDNQVWNRFEYLPYGPSDSIAMAVDSESPTRIEGVGLVDTDVLKLYKPMRYARVLVETFPSDDSAEVVLRRLSLCLSSNRLTMREYAGVKKENEDIEIGRVKLAVPYLTQRGMPEGLSGNCCSPTSMTMILNYYNKNVGLIPFCYEVYDPYHDMYGNWPYNVQAAYLAGMARTWVEIHDSFDEIYGEVSEGKPVVISIAYGYDELPNSPIHSAEVGHLVAVVGFDGPDTVICNDPAGHDAGDGIIKYPRRELERVWVNHGGVSYHLWPDW